ncbi:hypothetical protein OH768_12990 [Streptomyces sp. NBC_01622]|nr:hypothetical protein OH768_12990 [Streptomyces sp. NBC_01622]
MHERITAEPRLLLPAGGSWPVDCFRITTDDLDLLIREVLHAADAEHSAP